MKSCKPCNIKPSNKSILLPFIIIFSLIICSCNKTHLKQHKNIHGKIVIATLTDREKILVSGMGAQSSYIFDITLKDKDVTWIDFWVDHYEKGVLKSVALSGGVEINFKDKKEKKATLIFSIQDNPDNKKEEKWILSYNESFGASFSKIILKDKETNMSASIGNNNIEIVKDKNLNLAAIRQGKNSNGFSAGIFGDAQSALDEIRETDHVYMLRCKFSHKADRNK